MRVLKKNQTDYSLACTVDRVGCKLGIRVGFSLGMADDGGLAVGIGVD